MRSKVLAITLFIFGIALAAVGAFSAKQFDIAGDFPRNGLLIYAQAEDLPEFLKYWNDSDIMVSYTSSESYESFRRSHLGKKLASRIEEFSEGAGFQIDMNSLSSLSENRAAIGIYDIGRLDFLFIAPISDAAFELSKISIGRADFESEILENGVTLYRKKIKADNGRQFQELLFSHFNGRLIIGTSEQLLAAAIANISNPYSNKSLVKAQDFITVSRTIVDGTSYIWFDQAALNQNYHFKRYWLWSNQEDLQNIRTAMIALNSDSSGVTESRRYSLKNKSNFKFVESNAMRVLEAQIPAKVASYTIKTVSNETIDSSIADLLPRKSKIVTAKPVATKIELEDDLDFEFSYLGSKFDQNIQEDPEIRPAITKIKQTSFNTAFANVGAKAVLNLDDLMEEAKPLLGEFVSKRIIFVENEKFFDQEMFEKRLAEDLVAATAVESGHLPYWENFDGGRILKLPILGFSIKYRIRRNLIEISNGELPSSDENIESFKTEAIDRGLIRFSLIDLTQRQRCYDDFFAKISAESEVLPVFSTSIPGMLDSFQGFKTLTIRTSIQNDLLQETMELRR